MSRYLTLICSPVACATAFASVGYKVGVVVAWWIIEKRLGPPAEIVELATAQATLSGNEVS